MNMPKRASRHHCKRFSLTCSGVWAAAEPSAAMTRKVESRRALFGALFMGIILYHESRISDFGCRECRIRDSICPWVRFVIFTPIPGGNAGHTWWLGGPRRLVGFNHDWPTCSWVPTYAFVSIFSWIGKKA